MAAFNGPLHSYPSVPSGISEPVNPYDRKPLKVDSQGSFPLARAAHRKPTDKCLLLALPVELRLQILGYILPYTVNNESNLSRPSEVISWKCGCTAILATNKQLHEEASKMLYGDSIFDIDVSFDRSTFLFTRILESGLMPKQTPNFEARIAQRYWPLLRTLRIRVTLEDNYVAEVKFSWGGAGYVAGIKRQVQSLVDILKHADNLRLSLRLWNLWRGNANDEEYESMILAPFLDLGNVREWELSDHIPASVAGRLATIGPCV